MKFDLSAEVSAEIKKLAEKREIKPEEAAEVVAKYGLSRVKALGKWYDTHKRGDRKPKAKAKVKAKESKPKAVKASKPKGPLARKTRKPAAKKAPKARQISVAPVEDVPAVAEA